ncbi:MAG: MFS transporter [Synergistaceae bacterium]|nr:MFS transporter [Synergistaceae bacterium]
MPKITTQFALLRTRRFLPLFLTQFLGAFNDNLFKSALVILITFRLAEQNGMNAQILITLVAGLFILPFFLFSATAGQIADKYEKSFLIHIIKFVEIVLMCFTALAFQFLNLWGLIILLFFMGGQSAFFGPLKFSVLPQHLKENELVAGNGLVSAGTYIAILSGTLCGGLFILNPLGRIYISVGIVGVAILGYIASLFIPKAEAPVPEMRIDWNIPRATWGILSYVRPIKPVFRSILGISWFWFLGAVFLAQFPTFAKDILGGNEQVSTLFLIVFSLGVGFGSTLCNRILKGKVSAKLVAPSCIGLSLSTFSLYLFSVLVYKGNSLIGVTDFLKDSMSWGIILSLFLLAAFGGMFSVPMYAIMQSKSPEEHQARVVACLNITDSFGMVLSAVFVTGLLVCGVSIINIFLILGVTNLLITPLLSRMVGDKHD